MTSPQSSKPRPIPVWPLQLAMFSFAGVCCLLSLLVPVIAETKFNINTLALMYAGFVTLTWFGSVVAGRIKKFGVMAGWGIGGALLLLASVLQQTYVTQIAPLPREARIMLVYNVIDLRGANHGLFNFATSMIFLASWVMARQAQPSSARPSMFRLLSISQLLGAGGYFFLAALYWGDLWALLRVLSGF